MKRLLFIFLLIPFIGLSQGEYKKDFIRLSDFTTFTAAKDTTWDINTTGAYYFEYTIKWASLSATDSYMSVYLGGDPDGDGTLDWTLYPNLDSLQLTPASGVAKIRSTWYGTISDGLRLNYENGTVASGTIDLELNIVTKPTKR